MHQGVDPSAHARNACPPKWVGDQRCDPPCDTAENRYDGGDCPAPAPAAGSGNIQLIHSSGGPMGLSSFLESLLGGGGGGGAGGGGRCNPAWEGDGYCDCVCYRDETFRDGGDCVQGQCVLG